MQDIGQKTPLANNHISVDCVVIGFDGEQLKVLLIKRAGEEGGEIFHDMKLPGSLIYMDEDLDEAAKRVLNELTGLKNVNLMQFKAFGSKDRTKDPKDVHWLERAMQSKVERIVTIAYLSLVKIDRALNRDLDDYQASWVAMPDIKALAFDHNLIIKEAITYIRIDRIKGRSDDMFIIKGVNIFPMQVEKVLVQFPELGSNYLITLETVNNQDEMIVEVELSDLSTDNYIELEKIRKAITRQLKDEILVTPKLRLVKKGSLPQSEGKAVRVKDLRDNK